MIWKYHFHPINKIEKEIQNSEKMTHIIRQIYNVKG